MSKDSTSRTAVVTGGSRGIGRAIVSRLAAEGCAVVFSFVANEDAARQVEAEERAKGHAVWGVRGDQADATALEEFFDEAMSLLNGRLDAFVASAGIISHAAITETTVDQFQRILSVNLLGTFFAIQRAIGHMSEGGRIVCVSTMGTVWPSAGEAAYLASKAGIEQICRVASRELGPRGITVNCILPGPTDTDMLRAGVDDAGRQAVAGMTALGRLGTPDDVAGAVAVLTSPSAAWITGQNLRADGGLT